VLLFLLNLSFAPAYDPAQTGCLRVRLNFV
jgi:hypothetical protein